MAVELVREDESAAEVIAAYGFHGTTIYKWHKNADLTGNAGRADRAGCRRHAAGRLEARWAAVVLVLFTLPAAFIFHAYWSVPADQVLNVPIHYMKNLAIVGGLLGLFAHGSGPLALDRR